jgi:hypothetical protein
MPASHDRWLRSVVPPELLARTLRPTSNVGEAAIPRVEPDRVAHDVGDGLDLNLGDLFRARELLGVKQRVARARAPRT